MYRMKNIILLLIMTSFFISCAQDKETIYLLFESGKTGTCNVSPYRDGRDKKEVTFTYHKREKEQKNLRFEICYQSFDYHPQKHMKETLKSKPKNIVNIDYLLNKWEEKPTTFDRKTAFKNIYILEKNEKGEYISYQVDWVEVFENKY